MIRELGMNKREKSRFPLYRKNNNGFCFRKVVYGFKYKLYFLLVNYTFIFKL